jgi:hypothetical protein
VFEGAAVERNWWRSQGQCGWWWGAAAPGAGLAPVVVAALRLGLGFFGGGGDSLSAWRKPRRSGGVTQGRRSTLGRRGHREEEDRKGHVVHVVGRAR